MINTIVKIEHKDDFVEQGFNSHSYLAIDKRLNREVAVKDIIYENLTSESDFEKYFEEAAKLSLSAHPRVLPVYYVGLNQVGAGEIIPRIVTQFFKNGSLASHLKNIYEKGMSLYLEDVIRYAHDIIQGMIHLHSNDIVHLDLKASNIFIGDDWKMVIGDFGQSKFIKDGIISEKVDIYPGIAPPESRKALDKTADIYQFGLLLFSMVNFDVYRHALEAKYKISTPYLKEAFRNKGDGSDAAKADFKTNMKAYLEDLKTGAFPNLKELPYFVPSEILNIIKKCLSPVKERYNNFYDIQEDLNHFKFPEDVQKIYVHLETKKLHFIKSAHNCIISIQKEGDTYTTTGTKNERNSTICTLNGITNVKLQKTLFKLVSDI